MIEAVQSGFQEQYKLNSWMVIGNMRTLLSLLVASRLSPTIIGFILAINAPPLVARLANAGAVFIGRPYLRPRSSTFSWPEARPILASGTAYSLTTLMSFVNHQLPIILIGRVAMPQEAAVFAAAMNLFMISLGPVSMIAIPLWPAVSDSLARSDLRWAIRAFGRLLRYSVVYGSLVALGFGIAGSRILRMWFGGALQPRMSLMLLIGAYSFLAIWEYVHFMFLIGLNKIGRASGIYAFRSVLGLAAVLAVLKPWGGPGVCAALCASVLALTGWMYPRLIRQVFLARGAAVSAAATAQIF